jgi:hypothetical protein
METGNLDPLIEGPLAELDLIRQENELFMDGKGSKVRALVGDAHLLHMQEHRTLISNPLIRADDGMVQEVLAHMQMHMELYKTQDPLWSQVAGEPAAPAQGGIPAGEAMPPPGEPPPEPGLPEGAAPPPQFVDQPLV